MATRFAFAAALLFPLALLAAGCQDDVADDAPPPSFQAPVSAPRYVAAPAPTAAPAPLPPLSALRNSAPIYRRSVSAFPAVPADWIPHVQARPWQWIVIHHTATSFGNAAIVTRWHIDRGFDEMGYHFLIGNGTNSGDGQVEVGTRWPKQKWGAHTKTPDNRFNDFGIGICLVGNFDVSYPTSAQMHSLEKLVAYLMRTYHIPPDHVLGHSDCKSTDCPGKHLNVAVVRAAAVRILASEGVTFAEARRPGPNDELIHAAAN